LGALRCTGLARKINPDLHWFVQIFVIDTWRYAEVAQRHNLAWLILPICILSGPVVECLATTE